MSKAAIKIGPADNGRRMSLEDFDQAEVQAGYSYELGRGVIVVSDVPKPRHMRAVGEVRKQLIVYDAALPGNIHIVASGGECKILLEELESERHPDLAVYKTPAPDEDDPWAVWIPEIVVEVVSPGGESRDYGEKRQEYLDFGVREYWVVDLAREEVLVLRRSRGRWAEKRLDRSGIHRTPLLPGFELRCEPIFAAAQSARP